MKKKRIALILAVSLLLITFLSGFTNYDGFGEVHSESNQQIGPGTSYTSLIGNNSAAGGIVSAHVIDADVVSGKVKPYVYNGLVRKTYTVSSMANILANEGYKVVAGINGDIYDTASGTPKGAVIHDGILYTGGYQSDYLLSYDKDGNAAVSTQKISYQLKYQKYETTTVAPPAEEPAETTEPPVTETKIVDATAQIGYFNVPHGGGNALHLFNARYADTTKTTGTCVEAVLQVVGGDADLHIGDSIRAEVLSVNTAAHSTALGEGQLVLSANTKSALYQDICSMVPGSEVTVTVSVDGSSPISQAKEAMGVYNVLAYQGTVWTADKTLNPRTCLGIKPDGSTVLYVVDGRQNSVSKGMNAVDITAYLMYLGCETVVNMDGGGSTTMVARDEPGKSNSAKLVNSPSGGSMRSVANGLFFVYTNQDAGGAKSIAVYPENTLLMPGMHVELEAYGVNSLYEKAELPGDVTYHVDGAYGTVNAAGIFTADKNASGTAVITASSGKISGTTEVQIVRDFTFSVNKSTAAMTAGQTFDFNVSAVKYGNVPVLYQDDLFTWSCSPLIGTIDQNGKFTATDKKGNFEGNITVAFGSKAIQIPVKIQYTGGFTDIEGHWAKDYILNLTEAEIINGMTETTFVPDGTLTRAQFLTLLSKIDSEETVSGSPAGGFTDVAGDSWYYNCVNWGVDKGIVNGMGDGTFAPDAKVSREQMCMMLCNYYAYKGLSWEKSESSLNFPDKGKISDWALASVKKVVGEGIVSGRTDGTLDPLGNATRGEAAKIIYLLKEIYYYQTMN